MSNNNVIKKIDIACKHSFFSSHFNKKIRIKSCTICGVMMLVMTRPHDPHEWKSSHDIDCSSFLKLLAESVTERLYHEQENINLEYLNKRPKVMEYLKRLIDSFSYSQKTYHAALSYVDSILVNNREIKFDLAVISCLLLAENDPSLAEYSKFMNPKKEYYTKEEISYSERTCLKLLDYNLSVVTSYNILSFFLINGLVGYDSTNSSNIFSSTSFDYNSNYSYNEFYHKNLFYSPCASDAEVTEVDNFYAFSLKILNYFNEDVRSLDFSPLQVTIGSLLLASELIDRKFDKKVKQTLEQVYEIKIETFLNAYFVIRNIYPTPFPTHTPFTSNNINILKINKEEIKINGEYSNYNPNLNTNFNSNSYCIFTPNTQNSNKVKQCTGKNYTNKDLKAVNIYNMYKSQLNPGPNNMNLINLNLNPNPNPYPNLNPKPKPNSYLNLNFKPNSKLTTIKNITQSFPANKTKFNSENEIHTVVVFDKNKSSDRSFASTNVNSKQESEDSFYVEISNESYSSIDVGVSEQKIETEDILKGFKCKSPKRLVSLPLKTKDENKIYN